MKIENTLQQYIDKKSLIFVERKNLEDWNMECIPLKICGSWIAAVNTEGFKNNGYKLICFDDISDIVCDEVAELHGRIYGSLPQNNMSLPNFDSCQGIEDMLALLQKNHILVSIDSEEEGDCLYFTGKILSVKKGILTLLCYDELAQWYDDITELNIDSINTVTFFDRYSLIMSEYLVHNRR